MPNFFKHREAHAHAIDDVVHSADDAARTGSQAGSKRVRDAIRGATSGGSTVVAAVVVVRFRVHDADDVEKQSQAGAIASNPMEAVSSGTLRGAWLAVGPELPPERKWEPLGGVAVSLACGGVDVPVGAVAGGFTGVGSLAVSAVTPPRHPPRRGR